MTTSVAVTPERSEFWAFTKPYMNIPIVIVARTDVTYITHMQELAGKKVAVVDGYAVNDWIPRDFPEIRLIRVKTVQEGLEALQRREVFAYIENMLVVGYYLTKLKMATTLKIVGNTPYINAQSMAVRKDWTPLAGILDKVLDSISEGERNDIYRRWLPVRYEHGFDYALLWQALAVLAVILLGIAVWIRKLTKEIARRKKAEAASSESEERYRSFFAHSIDAVLLTAPDGSILEANPEACRIFGRTEEEIRQGGRAGVIDMTDPRLPAALEERERTGRFKGELNFVRKDGTSFPGEISSGVFTDRNGNHRTSMIIRDMTERRRVEAEQERFLHILESSLNEIYVFDSVNLAFKYVNRGALRNLGYTLEIILGMTPLDLKPEFTEDSFHQTIGPLLRHEQETLVFNTVHRRADGSLYPVEVHLQLVEVESRRMFLAIILDITGRKQAEEEIRLLNVELEQRIKERTAELEQKIIEIERINKLFVGRELRMAELKERIRELEETGGSGSSQ
jgi:PAS domain S-box-containing protein